jgi:hypothetical protein
VHVHPYAGQPFPFGGCESQMNRSESRRKLRLVVDIMLTSPKRGWVAEVLMARIVSRVTFWAGESVYLTIQAHTVDACQG